MAVTIPCQQCGHDNDLGRVFCVRCGKRLDSSRLSPDEIARRLRPQYRARMLKTAGVALLIVVLGLAALMFLPKSIDADEGNKRAGQGVQEKVEAVSGFLRNAESIGRRFTEKEVNGYFLMLNEGSSATVVSALSTNGFAFQVSRSYGPIVVGKYSTPVLRLAYTLTGAAREGRLVYKSAAIGHLPLPGPLKYILVPAAKGRALKGGKHEEMFDHVREITFDDGAVDIVFARGG